MLAESCHDLSLAIIEIGGEPDALESIVRVFNRIEMRRHCNPIHHLDDLEEWLTCLLGLDKRVLKELGYVCHVEHPHMFIPIYLNVLDASELMEAAWNLANDGLRTTLLCEIQERGSSMWNYIRNSEEIRSPPP